METREVSKLKTNPQNPRGAVEHDVSLRELAMSIKSLGILQPILITENDYIVAGHRRAEAAKLAGLESVPVIVKKLSQLEQLQMMLVENLQRADLNVLQEGAAYKTLIEYGLTPSLISKAIGVSGSRVADCLAIQDLPAEIQRQFAWGSIPAPCASVLVTLPTAAEQERWADTVIAQKMNAAALRDAIRGNGASKRSPSPSIAPKTVAADRPRTTVADDPNHPPFLRDMIRRLEDMDEALDRFAEYRGVQMLLRQAAGKLIDKAMEKKAEERTVNKSSDLASVASYGLRTGR